MLVVSSNGESELIRGRALEPVYYEGRWDHQHNEDDPRNQRKHPEIEASLAKRCTKQGEGKGGMSIMSWENLLNMISEHN